MLTLSRYQVVTSFGLYFAQFFIFAPNHMFAVFANVEPTWDCSGTLARNCSCAPVNMTRPYGYYSAANQFHMLCDRSYVASLISSLQMAGLLVGSFLFGQVSDFKGRRPTAIVGVIGLMVCSTFSLFAPSWELLATGRFFSGFFISAILVTIPGWSLEEVEPDKRMFVQAVANGWGVGRILMVFAAYVTKDWRYTVLICNAFGLPVLLVLLFVAVESSRWTVQHGEIEQIKKNRAYIAKINRCDVANVTFPNRIDIDDKIVTYKDLFSTKKLAGRTILMAYVWFTCALVSYGIDLKGGNLPGNIYLTQFAVAAGLATARPLAFFLDRYISWFSRRTLYLSTLFVPVVIITILAILVQYQGNPAIDRSVVVLSVAGIVIIEYHWIAIGLYSSELFPTVCRSSGYAFAALFGRLGNVLAPQILLTEKLWVSAPFVIFGVAGCLACIVCWAVLPDTKGEELPDTLKFEVNSSITTTASTEGEKLTSTQM